LCISVSKHENKLGCTVQCIQPEILTTLTFHITVELGYELTWGGNALHTEAFTLLQDRNAEMYIHTQPYACFVCKERNWKTVKSLPIHSNKLYVYHPVMLATKKKDVNTVKHNKLHYNYWLKQTSIPTVM